MAVKAKEKVQPTADIPQEAATEELPTPEKKGKKGKQKKDKTPKKTEAAPAEKKTGKKSGEKAESAPVPPAPSKEGPRRGRNGALMGVGTISVPGSNRSWRAPLGPSMLEGWDQTDFLPQRKVELARRFAYEGDKPKAEFRAVCTEHGEWVSLGRMSQWNQFRTGAAKQKWCNGCGGAAPVEENAPVKENTPPPAPEPEKKAKGPEPEKKTKKDKTKKGKGKKGKAE